MQLISVKKIWSKIKDDIGIDTNSIRQKLGIIINRRNKIAHEADINSLTGEKTDIERADVTETIDFIKNIVFSINKIISETKETSDE